MDETSELIQQRIRNLEELRAEGVDPFPNNFPVTHTSEAIHQAFDSLPDEALESSAETCSIAGRIMAIRDFGKASFIQIQDRKGRIQAYLRKDIVGEQAFKLFKKFDIGDVIGVKGKVFRTKTRELTLQVQTFQLLTKSLRPLPEKWHGLTDVEIRYRQRYLDLTVNPDVKKIFLTRMRAIRMIRNFFADRDFLEVETPMMHPIPGGATAKPFKTHHNALAMELYMRVAPELFLKRLVVGGFERIFEINRCFRNEGISTQHNPEFTMLEFYQTYATYEDMMQLTEELISSIVKEFQAGPSLTYQGKEIDFAPPWKKVRFKDSLVRIRRGRSCHPRRTFTGHRHGEGSRPRSEKGDVSRKGLGRSLQRAGRAPADSAHVHHSLPHGYLPLSRRNAEDPMWWTGLSFSLRDGKSPTVFPN